MKIDPAVDFGGDNVTPQVKRGSSLCLDFRRVVEETRNLGVGTFDVWEPFGYHS